ncbi:MAG: hypothetical protein ABL308_12805 [Oceanicaulis sp.]
MTRRRLSLPEAQAERARAWRAARAARTGWKTKARTRLQDATTELLRAELRADREKAK